MLVNRAPNGTHPPTALRRSTCRPTAAASSSSRTTPRLPRRQRKRAGLPARHRGEHDDAGQRRRRRAEAAAATRPGPDLTPDCRYVAFDSDADRPHRRDADGPPRLPARHADGHDRAREPRDDRRGGARGPRPPSPRRSPTTATASCSPPPRPTSPPTTPTASCTTTSSCATSARDTTTNVSRSSAGVAADGFRGAGLLRVAVGRRDLLGFYADSDNLSPTTRTVTPRTCSSRTSPRAPSSSASRASGATGAPANNDSGLSELSGDGTRVAFISVATQPRRSADPAAGLRARSRDRRDDPGERRQRRQPRQHRRLGLLGRRAADLGGRRPRGLQLARHEPARRRRGRHGLRGLRRVHPRPLGRHHRAGRQGLGRHAGGTSFFTAISADGENVAFNTPDGLVADDTDGQSDVYLHRLGPGGIPPRPEPEPDRDARDPASPAARRAVRRRRRGRRCAATPPSRAARPTTSTSPARRSTSTSSTCCPRAGAWR